MNYELAKKLKEAGFDQREWRLDGISSLTAEDARQLYHWGGGYHCTFDFSRYPENSDEPVEDWDGKMRASCYFGKEYLESPEGKERTVYLPTLSELIEAVGFCFATLQQEHKDRTPEGYLKFSGWKAIATDATCGWAGKGSTPEEAVSELWLNIKNNVYEYSEPPVQGIKFEKAVYDCCTTPDCKHIGTKHEIK